LRFRQHQREELIAEARRAVANHLQAYFRHEQVKPVSDRLAKLLGKLDRLLREGDETPDRTAAAEDPRPQGGKVH
jgi:ubiquinone biosynthesis protein UbiJ